MTLPNRSLAQRLAQQAAAQNNLVVAMDVDAAHEEVEMKVEVVNVVHEAHNAQAPAAAANGQVAAPQNDNVDILNRVRQRP